MSAIFGILNLDGQDVSASHVDTMLSALRHRGPDGAEALSEGEVALGHLMLCTTPESIGEQLPLKSPDASLAITADARLDNRESLAKALGLRSPDNKSVPDSKLILLSYERWGEDCVEHLDGDFAFVIWDARRHKLFCARDRFGVKPFYYYSSQDVFAFATEIKGVLCLPLVPRRLNEERVAEHLAIGNFDQSITFYRDVLRLPPAHVMTVTRDGVKQRKYWSLDPSKELTLKSDEEYAENFLSLFTEAVRCRLRSNSLVGAMLSGGLDSTSITCIARDLLREEGISTIPTFSAIHDVIKECDERSYQAPVIAQGGLEPHYVQNDSLSPLLDLDDVLWHLDEVQGAGNLNSNWGIYKVAKDRGVRVILDGFDGDSTVSHGRGYLNELAEAGRWLTLMSEVIAFSRIKKQSWVSPLWKWFSMYGVDPVISRRPFLNRLRQGGRRLQAKVSPSQRRKEYSAKNHTLNPEFVRSIGLSEMQRSQLKPRTERELHFRNLTNPGMAHTLEKLDNAAGAFSMEIRFPFWDKNLAEYCLSLPPTQKWSRGWTRVVLRRAMGGILPPEVQWRPGKCNMAPAFKYGFRTFARENVEQVVLDNPSFISKYVNIKSLREAYHRFASQEASDNDVLALWKAVSLALWLQRVQLEP